MSMMKVVVALVPSIAKEGENGGQEESQQVKTSIQMGQIKHLMILAHLAVLWWDLIGVEQVGQAGAATGEEVSD